MTGISHSFESSPVPAGVGEREEGLHPECGLRVISVAAQMRVDTVALGGAVAFGGAGGADVLDWTNVSLASNGRLYLPVTPTVLAISALPANKFVRVRIRGLDQFYSAQEEISPWIPAGPRANMISPVSKVFSVVTSTEYQSINFDLGSDFIGFGVCGLWDPINSADDTNNLTGAASFVNLDNMGFGIQMRISPYGTNDPYQHPEILGHIMAVNPEQGVDDGVPAVASIAPIPLSGAGAGFTVGASEPGWQGDPHKIGFQSTDDWVAQKILKVTGGEFRMGGEIEGVASTPPRVDDTLEFTVMVRTALGTRRRANPTTSYTLTGLGAP